MQKVRGGEREGSQYTAPPPCRVRSQDCSPLRPFPFPFPVPWSVSAQIQIQVRSLLPQIDPSSDGPSMITPNWLDWIGWWLPLPPPC